MASPQMQYQMLQRLGQASSAATQTPMRHVVNAVGNTGNAVGQGYQAVKSNPIAGFPLRHPLITTAAVGTAIAAPRVIGSFLPPETKEAVAQNPIGSAITGIDPNDPVVQRNAMIANAQEQNERMRQNMKEDYKDRAQYDSDLTFANAKRNAPLEYGWGSAVKFRDVYANQLDNEVNQYLNAMATTNDSVRNILANSNFQVI